MKTYCPWRPEGAKQIDDYVAKIESFLIFKEPQINFWHGKIGEGGGPGGLLDFRPVLGKNRKVHWAPDKLTITSPHLSPCWRLAQPFHVVRRCLSLCPKSAICTLELGPYFGNLHT